MKLGKKSCLPYIGMPSLVRPQNERTDKPGIDLKYKPLSLHQLVIEATSRRIRETNGKEEIVPFFVVQFNTEDLALIEAQIKKHKLDALAKIGNCPSCRRDRH